MADISPRTVNWLAFRNMDWEDAFWFFMQFSAMEYALKHAGFLRPPGNQRANTKRPQDDWVIAEADWTAFGATVERNIIGKDALDGSSLARLKQVQQGLQNPPPQSFMRNIRTDTTDWRKNCPRPNQGGICWTIECMKFVRNNLFHGEKSPMMTRDKEFIQQCTALIDILVVCCHSAQGENTSDEVIKMRDVYDHYRRVIG